MRATVGIPLAPNPTQERDDIVRAQAGDRAACRALIERHQRAVGSLLRRVLAGSGLDALTEDLAQETFLRAFAALPRFDPEGPARLSTWLLTIATRLALQAIERRRPPITSLDDGDDHASIDADELAPDRRRLGEAIADAIGRLPPPHRAAFVLREVPRLRVRRDRSLAGDRPRHRQVATVAGTRRAATRAGGAGA